MSLITIKIKRMKAIKQLPVLIHTAAERVRKAVDTISSSINKHPKQKREPKPKPVAAASRKYVKTFQQPKKKPQISQKYLQEINAAWIAWQNAVSYFDNVTDPELVEYAIYNVEAARRQYMYLVKQAKEQYGNAVPRNVSSALNIIREVNEIPL